MSIFFNGLYVGYIFIQKKKKRLDIYLWMEETNSTGLIIDLEEIDLSTIFQRGDKKKF
jgi:hypothetical protein